MKLSFPAFFATATLLQPKVQAQNACCVAALICDIDEFSSGGGCVHTVEPSNPDTCEYRCKECKAESTKSPKATKSPKTPKRRGLTSSRNAAAGDGESRYLKGKEEVLGCGPDDGIECSNVDDFLQCRESYVRVLYSGDHEKDLQLFNLMEGEEHGRHLSEYVGQFSNRSTIGICDHPISKFHEKLTTHEDCFSAFNQIPGSSLRDVITDTADQDEESTFVPWISPSSKDGDLKIESLASNLGMWKIDNFVNDEETEKILDLVTRYGEDHKMWGECKHEKRNPSNAHPMHNKICFKISTENVCDGPYDLSTCDLETEPNDAIFLEDLLGRFKSLWTDDPNAPFDPYPYAKFQRTEGDTGPVDLHSDIYTISFVLYLSDGGAGLIFPRTGTVVTPQKGSATTWLNKDKHGKRNPLADHAVQAHPLDEDKRLVMLFQITAHPQLILGNDEL